MKKYIPFFVTSNNSYEGWKKDIGAKKQIYIWFILNWKQHIIEYQEKCYRKL